MARLPTIDDLGARPIPVSRRGIASNPAAGAVGQALESAGGEMFRTAERQLEKEDKLAYAAARGAYLKADIEARRELEDDPDFATYDKRYSEKMATARAAAAGMIRSKADRAVFEMDSATDFERGRSEIIKRARDKEVVAKKATLFEGLEGLQDTGLEAGDDGTRQATLRTANEMIQGALESGVVDPFAAAQLREEFAGRYAASQITRALNRDDPDAAAGLLTKFGNMLPWDTRDKLEARAKAVLDGRTAKSDADWAVDGTTVPGTAQPPSEQAMFGAIIAQESGGRHFAANGKPTTSPKGATGIAQVMPGTGPEAAKLAGLPWDPQKFRSDPEYNAALGRAYFKKQLETFGDPAKAAAAYNAGPGRVQAAIAKAEKAGKPETWTTHLPKETRQYVENFRKRTGIEGAEQSPQRHDLNQAYARIDERAKRESWTPERTERAKRAVDDVVQRDELLANRRDAENIRVAEEKIATLGEDFTDISQVPNYEYLPPSAKLELQNRARINADRKAAATRDIALYNTALGTPGFQWNPYSPEQKKAVDAAYVAQGGGARALADVWQRTGIVPPSAVPMLRGSLVSTDPDTVRQAANLAGNMLRRNPNAFAGIEGGDDIERAGLAFNEYTYSRGMSPEQAAARIAKENTPEFKRSLKIADADITAYRKQIRDTGIDDAGKALGGHFATARQVAEANQTLSDLIIDNVRAGQDLATAKGVAVKQMRRIYGVNSRGNLKKYAPELAYPPLGGGHVYIYFDASAAVKKATGQYADEIAFWPIPGKTDDDFRRGRPPRYRIGYGHTVNGQRVYDILPGDWAADVDGWKAKISAMNASRAKGERDAWLRAQQQAMIETIGPVGQGSGGY